MTKYQVQNGQQPPPAPPKEGRQFPLLRGQGDVWERKHPLSPLKRGTFRRGDVGRICGVVSLHPSGGIRGAYPSGELKGAFIRNSLIIKHLPHPPPTI